MEIYHTPVLLKESIELMSIHEGSVVVDATVGEGGHSVEILKRIGTKGLLIGIDLDGEGLRKASKRLKEIGDNFILVEANFRDILVKLKSITSIVDAVLADLGLSSLQLEEGYRGFSFMKEGPLDMRMCLTCTRFSAYDVVNSFREDEIANILLYYGEETHAQKIAYKIVSERKIAPISTTTQLATIVQSIFPKKYYKIHPATRTFQAIRIFVNGEIENLKRFLKDVPDTLRKDGRVAIISYHSLEDRLVKSAFKSDERLERINKHVIVPQEEEVESNRRSRSAKLRVAKRV
jgi:16S rRNA (cytosine1402-N4)-methyltransferase